MEGRGHTHQAAGLSPEWQTCLFGQGLQKREPPQPHKTQD